MPKILQQGRPTLTFTLAPQVRSTLRMLREESGVGRYLSRALPGNDDEFQTKDLILFGRVLNKGVHTRKTHKLNTIGTEMLQHLAESVMKWKIRRYGRSYIYDRLHRATVTILMGLSAIGFIQFAILSFPIVQKHLRGSPAGETSEVKEENKIPELATTG